MPSSQLCSQSSTVPPGLCLLHGPYLGGVCPGCSTAVPFQPTDPAIYSTPRITMTKSIVAGASDVDVIAALKIAVEATEDWEKLGQVTKAILEASRETPDDNTGGLELLLRLHRDGTLKFEVAGD